MSTSPDTDKAWRTVMRELATQYVNVRSPAFYNSMREFAQLSPDNRPIVTPYGILIAEMIGSIAILKGQVAAQKISAMHHNDSHAVQYYTHIDSQLELTGHTICNIHLN